MKLCSIIIAWIDTIELLPYCIFNHLLYSDHVIVIYSNTSNYGEHNEGFTIPEVLTDKFNPKITALSDNVSWIKIEPNTSNAAVDNERGKRNFGLQQARNMGFTHFIMADADEFYNPWEVNKIIDNWNDELTGIVCKSQVYFKSPTLTIGLDSTLVPFIHRINPNLGFTWNKEYPFAWSADKKQLLIDPTRQLNISKGVEMCDLVMHHYSWVRRDYQMKIRNSSARHNLERSSILQDILQAKEGYFCEFYQKTLVRADVDFGIPEITAQNE